MPPEESAALVEGPWRHRSVRANGIRLHVAESGPADGPLVLLLHGFPHFWWTWRHQLVALGEAGLRAVAVDLRGHGASDKPPRGYDQLTLTADVAGLVKALGADDAVLVGAGWGGSLAWGCATLRPEVVRALVTVGSPHPMRVRQSLLHDRGQLRASAYLSFFQLPSVPEARLVRDDAAFVGRLLRHWGGPGYPDAESDRLYRTLVQVPGVANCSLEAFRWHVRSLLRPSGRRWLARMDEGVHVPVWQVHGDSDPCMLARTAVGSDAWVRSTYSLDVLDGVGHFPHEERPEAVTAAVLTAASA